MLSISKKLFPVLVVLFSFAIPSLAHAQAHSGVGRCPGGQVVIGVNTNAPPTCGPGGGTAGNAVAIQGIGVSSTAPTDQQRLCYVAADLQYEPCANAAAFPLAGDSSAASHKITNLAAGTTLGDAVSYGQAGANFGSLVLGNGVNHSLLIGGAAGAVGPLSPGISGLPLISSGSGADPTWQVSGIIGGGTGKFGFQEGSVVLGSNTNTLNELFGTYANTIMQGANTGTWPSFTATPTLGTNGSLSGKITFNGGTSGHVSLAAPASSSTNPDFTLPSDDGLSGYVLSTDGAKHWSFVPPGGGGGSSFPLATDVSAASHRIQNLAPAQVAGDSIAQGQLGATLANSSSLALNATPTFVSAGTSGVITTPIGITNGLVEVAMLGFFGDPGVVTPPAGWTEACHVVGSGSAEYAFTHTASSEPATVTWTWANSVSLQAGGMVALNNINAASPVDVCQTSTHAAATSFSLAGFTANAVNEVVVSAASFGAGTGIAFASPPPASLQTNFYINTHGGASWTYINPTTTVPALSLKSPNGQSATWNGIQLALKTLAPTATSVIAANQGDTTLSSMVGVGAHPTVRGFSVNGVENVKAWGAVGDGATDDTTAIQNAISYACGKPVHGGVYFPVGSYLHSKPIQVTCSSLEVYGQGTAVDGGSSNLIQNYRGPSVIAAGVGTDTLQLTGPALVTGTTQSLQTTGCSGNNCSYTMPSAVTNWHVLDGISNFTIQGFFEPTSSPASKIIAQSWEGFPSPTKQVGAFKIAVDASSHLTAQGRSSAGLATLTGTTVITQNVVHHYALVLDANAGNATWRLFLDGNQEATTSTGLASTLSWSKFESQLIGNQSLCADNWPDVPGGSCSAAQTLKGYIGPQEIAKTARYTANFTAPTADFTADSNTILIVDFPVSPSMTTLATGWTTTLGATNVYLPIEGGLSSASQANFLFMHDLELCGNNSVQKSDGLFTDWTPTSTFQNLSCYKPDFAGFRFVSNSFNTYFNNLSTLGGDIGIEYGVHDAENVINASHVTGAMVSYLYQQSGGFVDTKSTSSDAGNNVYGFVAMGTQPTWIWPFEDQETTNTVKQASYYIQNDFNLGQIIGGQLNTRNSAPFITMNTGAPIAMIGTNLSGFGQPVPAAQIVHVIASPTTPVVLEDVPQWGAGSYLTITDSPQDVVIRHGGVNSPLGPKDYGTVSVNTSVSGLGEYPVQKLSTATNGLTYTLATAGAFAGQQIELDLFTTGTLTTAPTIATATGAIMWQGGLVPALSVNNSLEDILKLKYDGTNWIEISRTIGIQTALGSVPVVSSCGGSPTVTAGSNDRLGEVTIGGGTVTACTITFVNKRPKTPKCFLQDTSSFQALIPTSVSATAMTISAQADMNSDVIDWYCPEQ